jgi:hypothetical protein
VFATECPADSQAHARTAACPGRKIKCPTMEIDAVLRYI